MIIFADASQIADVSHAVESLGVIGAFMVLCTVVLIVLWKQVFSPGAKVFSVISGNIRETTASLERQGAAHDERIRRMDEQLADVRKSSEDLRELVGLEREATRSTGG